MSFGSKERSLSSRWPLRVGSSGRGFILVATCFQALTLLACQEASPPERSDRPKGAPAPRLELARVERPPPKATFECADLRSLELEQPSPPETIGLRPPGDGKKIVISKVGVIVTFSRDEFLRAAHCMKMQQAVKYLERETGFAEESPIMDAFQTSYVAAALLDAGRAGVRAREEKGSRASILRDPWSDTGCNGRCRSSGRLYRLPEHDSFFFLRITDSTRTE